MMNIIASFAEFELSLIKERTRAGLAYAVSKGVVLGRPPTTPKEDILLLHRQGVPQREIQKLLGCSKGAIYRAIQSAPKSLKEIVEKLDVETGGSNGE